MPDAHEVGRQGEELAAQFYASHGYQVLERNFRFQKAEVDLIVLRLEPAELVFVEVKTRTTTFAPPEAAVTPAKQRLLLRAAEAYLHQQNFWTVPSRFDVLAIGLQNPETPEILHIPDAFRAQGGFSSASESPYTSNELWEVR